FLHYHCYFSSIFPDLVIDMDVSARSTIAALNGTVDHRNLFLTPISLNNQRICSNLLHGSINAMDPLFGWCAIRPDLPVAPSLTDQQEKHEQPEGPNDQVFL